MNAVAKKLALSLGILALTGCGGTPEPSVRTTQQQPIKIDGSSTVYPITEALAKEYEQQTQAGKTQIQVAFSGTGGGFRKFCAGETDINNASRPIVTSEMEACKQAGVQYIELPVGYDGLTVVVHPQNNWAKDITVAELKKIWEPSAEGKITNWKQVRADWPDRPLKLYGAGKDSGTFDYFTEAIVGQSKASRNDYTASEDDNVLVNGVSQDPNALGYFGYSYYEAAKTRLKPLAIDNGNGSVLPSRETVKNSQYQPLSRPLFIYVSAKSVEKPEVRAFVDYYLTHARRWVNREGYVPLPEEAYRLATTHFQNKKVGTVFAGQSQINLKLEDLLQKEAKF